MDLSSLELLAQLPSSYIYIHPVKLAAIVVPFILWAMFAQWVDKDTVAVNTFRILWNLIVLGSGAVAVAAALLVPLFLVGYPAFLVINITVAIIYIVHRNGLVKEEDRVLTAAHFKRLREEGFSGKKKPKEVKERVRLTNFAKKVVTIPTEEVEREQYRLTQDLLFTALWRRAQSVELSPAGPQVAKIVYSIDGMPYEGETLSRADAEALVHYMKLLAGLNLEERRKPQKGLIMAAIGDQKQKMIVRTDGSTAGEKLMAQVLGREVEYKVPDLGFNPKQLEVAQATKEESRGLILLSGPNKCGLTTTVYSFTRNHDRFLQNVQTIEYEKEVDLDNVTQNIFLPTDTTTFAERLLKLVRSDPDIIVLPDVREREAATIAAKAAAEKQKVYVALPALDVFDALRRWLTAVGDKALAAKGLLAVSNQRLMRVLCGECKQAYKPDAQMMRKLNLPEDRVLYRPPDPQYDKKGNAIVCQACQGTGYVGRTAVFTWLPVDDRLRDIIRKSTSMSEIQAVAIKRGGLDMQAQALQKVLDGVTSIQEVARVFRSDASEAGAGGEGGPVSVATAPRPAAPKPAPSKPAAPKAAPPRGPKSTGAGGER